MTHALHDEVVEAGKRNNKAKSRPEWFAHLFECYECARNYMCVPYHSAIYCAKGQEISDRTFNEFVVPEEIQARPRYDQDEFHQDVKDALQKVGTDEVDLTLERRYDGATMLTVFGPSFNVSFMIGEVSDVNETRWRSQIDPTTCQCGGVATVHVTVIEGANKTVSHLCERCSFLFAEERGLHGR